MRSDGDQMCEILINVPYYIVMAQMTFYARRKIFNFRAPQGIDYEIPWFFPDIIKFPDSLSAENIAKHKYKCSSTTCSDHIPELLLNWWICVQRHINISRQCGYLSHFIICVLNKFPDIFRNFQISPGISEGVKCSCALTHISRIKTRTKHFTPWGYIKGGGVAQFVYNPRYVFISLARVPNVVVNDRII